MPIKDRSDLEVLMLDKRQRRAAKGNGETKKGVVMTVATEKSPEMTMIAQDTTISDFLEGEGRLSLWTEVRSFLTICGFITRLPVPTYIDLHPGFVMKGMAYMCAVGTLMGVFLATIFDVCHVTLGLPLIISACLTVTTSDTWMTGCFHQDGLADSADGIGGGWTTKQVLKITSDSRVGTYGCAAFCLYTITKIQLLAAHGASQWNFHSHELNGSNISSGAGPAIVASQALARLTAPFLIRTRDYIDDSTGPKTEFYSFFVEAKYLVSWPRVLVAILTCFLVVGVMYGPLVAVLMIISVIATSHVAGSYADFWLGGVMGDYLGATICITELICLILLLLADTHQEFLKESLTVENLIAAWPQDLIQEHVDQQAGLTHHLWTEMLRWKPSDAVMALARFLVIVILLSIWCSTVGHPRVMWRDWPPPGEDEQQAEDATTSKVKNEKSPDATTPSPELPPKAFAETTLAMNNSSFAERYHAVQSYIDTLAKPVGSLGSLEDWAARLAALQRTIRPTADPVACLIFAADHGAAKAVEDGGEGCSLYPPAVTQSILQGLQRGIAGASFLAKTHQVILRVVDVGVASENLSLFDNNDGTVLSSARKLVGGTQNLCAKSAMTLEECERCIQMGRDEFSKYVSETKASIVALGEVGIGNTTASSALISHFTKAKVETVCGGGATTASQGANDASVHKKVQLVKKALRTHGNAIRKSKSDSPAKEALARLGGAEIAALVGAMLEAAERGNIAILVDGFIVTAAALVATTMEPVACSHVLFLATQSAEKGHGVAIAAMQQLIATATALTTAGGSIKEKQGQGGKVVAPPPLTSPALNMNLRMGEGTAALLAVPLIRSAAAMLSEMGTIEDILAGET